MRKMSIDVFSKFCRSLVSTIGKPKLKICAFFEVRDFDLILCIIY